MQADRGQAEKSKVLGKVKWYEKRECELDHCTVYASTQIFMLASFM